jgi:hypothetical protein
MFGHGAFDIYRSFRNEGSESLPDANDVYENLLRCYGVNPPCTDAERDSWDETWGKVQEIQNMLFEYAGTTGSPDSDGVSTSWNANKGLKWCVCGDKFHMTWLNDSDETQVRSAYISPITEEQLKFELRKMQQYGDHWTPWSYGSYRVGCSSMGVSVDCADSNAGAASSGNNAGSGAGNSNAGSGAGSGNDAEMKPLFCWKCPAGYILGGLGLLGAGYVYFMIKHPGYWVAGQAIGTGGNLLGKMFGK